MPSAVEIKNLKFKWPNQKSNIIDIHDFCITPGEFVFLQGPSGSGKSTLLNLIGGILKPQKGSLSVFDAQLSKLSAAKRDKFRGDHMGFVFQMFNLLPYFSAIENVTLPCRFSKLKTEKVLSESRSLEEEAERLLTELKLSPNSIREKSVTELSVGQQQRVAVARALMGSPQLIVADEPTSALDTDVRDLFLKLLFKECRHFGMTLIFVSHDHSLGSQFDRAVSLQDVNQSCHISSDLEDLQR